MIDNTMRVLGVMGVSLGIVSMLRSSLHLCSRKSIKNVLSVSKVILWRVIIVGSVLLGVSHVNHMMIVLSVVMIANHHQSVSVTNMKT